MNIEIVPIDSVFPDPANLRRHPARSIEGIKASIARFKQQRPIIVGHDNVIVAGHGTHAAMKELGYDEIKIVRSDLQGAERIAYGLADNKTAELSEWDTDGLAQALAALSGDDAGLVEAAGFTPDELANLLESQQPAAVESPPEFPEVSPENIDTNCTCPKCGFRWSNGKA